MGEELGEGRINRRDLLKKSAVAGGLIWAAPVVFSNHASAATTDYRSDCSDCPSGSLYGVRFNTDNLNDPESINFTGGGGGDACVDGSAATVSDGSCFWNNGFKFYAVTSTRHIYVLYPALDLCDAGSSGASVCTGGSITVHEDTAYQPDADPNDGDDFDDKDNYTTVVIDDPQLSHSEIVFCFRGSLPASCT